MEHEQNRIGRLMGANWQVQREHCKSGWGSKCSWRTMQVRLGWLVRLGGVACQVGVAGWLEDLVCQVRVWGDLSVRKWEEGEEEVAALSSWMWSLI